MAATMAGAVKAYLETLGLGVPWYRDGKPPDTDLVRLTKWGVIQEGIGYAADLSGDYGDEDAHQGTRELVQLDLWQRVRGNLADGHVVVTEDYALSDRITAALPRPRALQQFAPWRIYGVTGLAGQRWPLTHNLLRRTWTMTVHRDTERIPTP